MKKNRLHFYISLLPFILISQVLKAQNNQTSLSNDSLLTLDLNEIIYSATRVEIRAFNAAEAVSLLNKKNLSLNAQRNIPEILLETPGVFIQKTNHGGGSAIVRGLTGNQILYLVDGIRLNNAITRYGPNQYLNTVDRFSIDRMEILRGSGSVLFGSDAIGGVINMLSYEPSAKDETGFSSKIISRIGTHNMEKSLHGRVNFQKNNSWISSGITRRNFGDLIGGKKTGYQRPSGYDELGYDVKTKIQIDDRQSIQGLLQFVGQQNVPVYHKYILENFDLNKMDPQKRTLAYVAYTFTPRNGFIQKIKILPSFQKAIESRWSKKKNSLVTSVENDTIQVMGLVAEIHTSQNIAGWKWLGSHGFDGYFDKVNSQRIRYKDPAIQTFERGLYPNKAEQLSYAFFTNQQIENRKFQLSIGNRFQFLTLKIPIEGDNVIDIKPSAWVGNLYLSQSVSSSFKIIYGMNTGFRAPNIDDLGSLGIVDFRYEIPNYGLRPEKSTQCQIGYKWTKNQFSSETYLYHNQLKDLIVRNKKGNEFIDGYPVFVKENAENGYIRGLESNIQWILHQRLQLMGSLTYTLGQNTSKNEPLRRIPPLYGYINMQYKDGKYWGKLFIQMASTQQRLAAGDVADNRIGPLGTPGWTTVNISNGLNINKIECNVTLQNLFNMDYKFHGSGINGVGRSIIFGLSWSI
jgi:outer membrane cobalamin receptor